MSQDKAKWAAASGALQFIEDGMTVGLGTGSTAEKFLDLLAKKVKSQNWHIVCVPTSEVIAVKARELGLEIDKSYPDFGHIDVTVDGADEVDPNGCLIKGGGGALLREKYVASASDKMIVIVDKSKHVDVLGQTFKLPVEIVDFARSNTLARIEALGYKGSWRMKNGALFKTDQGNCIADLEIIINDPAETSAVLKSLTGVVETGIFAGIATAVVTGSDDGSFDIKVID